ncbi:hypothetical protein V2I01_27135 [Micromonospora sp. BRA006-A]|nr:hypothetical protein [Micromonospora sp. BRA006-A]
MPLEVHHDHLVRGGQRGQDRREHLTRGEAAVQQDHRPALAVRLVVEVDAVDVGVPPRGLWVVALRCGHRCSSDVVT